MIPIQDMKFVPITPPGAIVDNASWTTTEIDTQGFDYLTVVVVLGATDVDMAALKVTESDTSGSGHADVSGLDFSSDGTLPTATDDNNVFLCQIDLRKRKRYIDLVATAGDGTTGTYLTALAILSRAADGVVTATEKGAAQVLTV